MLWSIARTDKHPTLKDDQIYDSYLAEKGLKLALHYENLDKYLKIDADLQGNGMVEIIKALIKIRKKENICFRQRNSFSFTT